MAPAVHLGRDKNHPADRVALEAQEGRAGLDQEARDFHRLPQSLAALRDHRDHAGQDLPSFLWDQLDPQARQAPAGRSAGMCQEGLWDPARCCQRPDLQEGLEGRKNPRH